MYYFLDYVIFAFYDINRDAEDVSNIAIIVIK